MRVTIPPSAEGKSSASSLTRDGSHWLLSAALCLALAGSSAFADSQSMPSGETDEAVPTDVSLDLDAQLASLFGAMDEALAARTEGAANRVVSRAVENEMGALIARLDRSAEIRSTVDQRTEWDLDVATTEFRARALSRAFVREDGSTEQDPDLIAREATTAPHPLPAAIR